MKRRLELEEHFQKATTVPVLDPVFGSFDAVGVMIDRRAMRLTSYVGYVCVLGIGLSLPPLLLLARSDSVNLSDSFRPYSYRTSLATYQLTRLLSIERLMLLLMFCS